MSVLVVLLVHFWERLKNLDKSVLFMYNAYTVEVLPMEYLELNGNKYPKVTLHWMDITGDSTTVGSEDFEEMECAHIVSEGYLYDTFNKDGIIYVRTFSSYEIASKPAFGDRNVFPLSVFTKESKQIIKKVIQGKETDDS